MLLGQILRVLLVLLLLRFFLRFLGALVRSLRAPASAAPKAAPPGGVELVRDPVCGTYVPRPNAVLATVGGRPLAFCSTACRDRALGEAGRLSE